ncbi:hypothetical protein [Limosilactobacillus albertensis]|uniref:Uncharacterized protein n=1 Tax=Limosilactobacillus albertensis TaxID=2759752 RepID=A0A839GWJ3_9LACO|nr:hypothetical protein [Limosilactobacillus albertensis]MBB1122765.1 hypothetical protein [Limosilactobacillus albertensis]MCD7122591.1 hypothetical protein [Limosilactobacillus albertensis]
MTENQTEILTDDELLELAKDLIEDHDELKDENVTTDDLVKILANVDDEFVKAMISSKYQVVYGTGLLVSVKYLLRDLAAVSIAEELKSLNYSENVLTEEILNFAATSVNSYMPRKNDLSGIYANIEHYSDLVTGDYCSVVQYAYKQYLKSGNDGGIEKLEYALAEALKDIVNSNGRELLPSDQIYYEGLIERLKERQEENEEED